MIFDTHAHYDDEAFDGDREELLSGLAAGGIGTVVNVGADMASTKTTIALTEKYPFIYGAAGVHPSSTAELDEEKFAELRGLAQSGKIVASGEIGLDYQRIFPATLNAESAVRHVERVTRAILGDAALISDVAPSLGGEDFAFMLEHCPGAYFFLGTAEGEATAPLHNARFDFNDALIPTGCRLLTAIALAALGTSTPGS